MAAVGELESLQLQDPRADGALRLSLATKIQTSDVVNLRRPRTISALTTAWYKANSRILLPVIELR
ncbi:hypothetical protein PC116_g27558 [Phytophthora cactorum]|uniref:Uncharacterized protein n=1 Tax=Phytophthora cactorum TaxID=29920 RepID=A0A8T1JPK6_9STRA|nr:hypothetical protein PC117_g25786 [Phytophthora cactorum]KAG3113221.1 hypothetical protein C6341_g27766 [Phytophthora cactorum]KAG4223981.1 hypothetical protein PC116_g27558 [Phytophthora cactorum]